MTSVKRILLTGDTGYIGSVLSPVLQAEGFEVTGLDTGYFQSCTLVQPGSSAGIIRKDIRDLTQADLENFDAVVHLAALSNDPLGNLNGQWTDDINHLASVRLASLARRAGVRRFLFSSSCIMYGSTQADFVDETSPLAPTTDYARSKVLAERGISAIADDTFSPTFLRNGTIYGLSPRMRFDTVLNDLVGSAMVTGRVIVYSDGAPWRPVVHVDDVARAFVAVLRAPVERVHNQAINTGANHLNHRVLELAEAVAAIVPGCRVEVHAEAGADQRTYRSDFGRFKSLFPDFTFEYTLEKGIRALYESLQRVPLTPQLFRSDRFVRLRRLRHLLESGQLDSSLRWASATPESAYVMAHCAAD